MKFTPLLALLLALASRGTLFAGDTPLGITWVNFRTVGTVEGKFTGDEIEIRIGERRELNGANWTTQKGIQLSLRTSSAGLQSRQAVWMEASDADYALEFLTAALDRPQGGPLNEWNGTLGLKSGLSMEWESRKDELNKHLRIRFKDGAALLKFEQVKRLKDLLQQAKEEVSKLA